ncbi:MAG: UDP-N-acetylglucosamine 2-epimerase [Bacteroidota bacterium]
MATKKIVFLTGTRADFGKLKSLIESVLKEDDFEMHIFATGMHMNSKYGKTVDEIRKCGYPNIFSYINHHDIDSMDAILSKTIEGFSSYVKEMKPDLIVIHGDRVEALAGAIVGALNNILVAHIEGGEISGTIDELIRHAVSKMSHVHFVANDAAKNRLIQMGEHEDSVFVIGSPDVDVMLSDHLPTIQTVKEYYEIPFEQYALVLFHPVTTEIDAIPEQAENFVNALIASEKNYVIIFPNNDMGNDYILRSYKKLQDNPRFLIFPSVRFEYFLILLKYAKFIIGNSSAGIREAPYYGIPTINIGSRQNNRSANTHIINVDYSTAAILGGIEQSSSLKVAPIKHFGEGKSDKLFISTLLSPAFWNVSKQKSFIDFSSTSK